MCIRDSLNPAAAAEHAPEIERWLRVIKEHFRALKSTLPFKIIPGRITIEAIDFCVVRLNPEY